MPCPAESVSKYLHLCKPEARLVNFDQSASSLSLNTDER